MVYNKLLLFFLLIIILIIKSTSIIAPVQCIPTSTCDCDTTCDNGEDVGCTDCPVCADFCGDNYCAKDCSSGFWVQETPSNCPADCCSNDCSSSGQTACVGDQLKTCGYYDADPCLDWSAPSNCPAYQKCISGTCQYYCGNGQCEVGETCTADSCCNGNPVNLQTDNSNCGSCNNPCNPPTTVCQSGVCTSTCTSECSSGQKRCFGSGYQNCVQSGSCWVWGTVISCSDGNTCSVDSCSNGNCVYTANTGASCDDLNSCTINDQCQADKSCSGQPKDCDDSNVCTADSCNPSTGCVHSNQPSSTQCGTDTICSYTGCSGLCSRTGTYTDYHCNGAGTCIGFPTACSAACTAGTACSGGSCNAATETCADNIDNNCNGQTDCQDSACNGQTCAQNKICSGGNCVCNNQCSSSQKQCAGNGYKTCENIGGCWVWSETITQCPSGQTCSGDNCVACTSGLQCVTPPNTLCYNTQGTCGTLAGTCSYTKKSTGTGCGTNKECKADGSCDCINPCTSGSRQCSSTTSYQLCQLDANGCSFWGSAASCGINSQCSGGYCSCISPWQACGMSTCSINTQTDANNCGSCSKICSFANAIAACSAGICVMGSCNNGYADKDASIANGCECQIKAEICNNDADDDCDGIVDCLDPDCSGKTECGCTAGQTQDCGLNVGICKLGKRTCTYDPQQKKYMWGPCTGNTEPSNEICDGLDNDCDNSKDEECDKDADGYCDSAMQCAGTVLKCSSGKCTDCDDTNKDANPGKTEACNNLDDNCDGQKNEGNACTCTTQAVLSTLGSAEIVQPSPGATYYLGDDVYFYSRPKEGTAINSYDWSLGDGSANTYQSFSHIYASAGDYEVMIKYYVESREFSKVCEKISSVNLHIIACRNNNDCTLGKVCQAGVCKQADATPPTTQPLTITINSPTNQFYAQKIVPLSIATSRPSVCSYSLNSADHVKMTANTKTIEGKEGLNRLDIKCNTTIASTQFTVKLITAPATIFDDMKGNETEDSLFSSFKDKGEEFKVTTQQAQDVISEVMQVSGLEITKSIEVSGSSSLVMLNVRNILPMALENTKVRVTIPKAAAKSSAEVKPVSDFTVIEKDPVIQFILNMTRGAQQTLAFEIAKVIDQKLLDQISIQTEEDLSALLKRQQETADAVKITKEFEEYSKDGETYTKIKTRITPKKGLKGMSVIEKIPKCLAKQIDYIKMDEKYRSQLKVLNADPLIMWQFEEITSEKYFEYEVKGVLSEDCKKQIRSLGIADELGLDIESRNYFRIMLPLLVIPLAGLMVAFLHRKPHEAIIEALKGKSKIPAENPKEKKEEKKPIMEEKEEDMGRFLDREIEEAEGEFKRRLKS